MVRISGNKITSFINPENVVISKDLLLLQILQSTERKGRRKHCKQIAR